MAPPPLLPEERLARTVRLARFDGLSVLVLGALFALATAAARDLPFAMIGLLAAGAGAVELHGVALLKHRDRRGMTWLIISQPYLLLVILVYCYVRLTHFAMPPLPAELRELAAARAQEAGMTLEQAFKMANRLAVLVVGIGAVAYQGGMTILYLRRRAAVLLALESPARPE